MNSSEIRTEIIQFLKQNTKNAAALTAVTDQTNLIESGLLDSIDFIGLVSHLEMKFGVEFDLVEQPIEDFVVLGSLIRQVEGIQPC